MVLELQKIRFVYSGAKSAALDGVSLSLAPGSCLGLIGPNGAGKSTLLRVAAGLAAPTDGDAKLDGKPSRDFKPAMLGRFLAYVPQSFTLPFTFRVLEIVLQGRHPHLEGAMFESSRDMEIAREAMERTGVWHLRERTFDALSGGERQRVVIAAALAQEPKLLILDEPTSSLDLRFQSETVRLLRGLVDEKRMAVLVALHDLNLASSLCDELLLLVDGRARASGAPKEVLTKETLEDAYETPIFVGEGPQGLYILPLIEAR